MRGARPLGRLAVGIAGVLLGLAGASAAVASPSFVAPVALGTAVAPGGGWIDDAGVLRTATLAHGRATLTLVRPGAAAAGAPRAVAVAAAVVGLGQGRTLVVSGGDPVRLAVLGPGGARERTLTAPGRLPALLGTTIPFATRLPGGGAALCTDLSRDRGETLTTFTAGGRRSRLARLVRAPGASATSAPTGGCYGVAAAGHGHAVMLVENAEATFGSGARDAELLLARIGSDGRLGSPSPLVPAGERFTVNAGEPQLAETPAGWTVVSWLSSRPAGERVRTRQHVRWVAPDGRLGPVRPLAPAGTGIPPAVTLAATGARAAVALVNPESPDRAIDTATLRAPGTVTGRGRLFAGTDIVAPVIAGAPSRLLAAWTAASGLWGSERRDGRWSAPRRLLACETLRCPFDPSAAVSPDGRRAALLVGERDATGAAVGAAVVFGRL